MVSPRPMNFGGSGDAPRDLQGKPKPQGTTLSNYEFAQSPVFSFNLLPHFGRPQSFVLDKD